MAKKGQNKGTRHAAKAEENRSVKTTIRFTPTIAAQFKAAAKAEGISLTDWVIDAGMRKLNGN